MDKKNQRLKSKMQNYNEKFKILSPTLYALTKLCNVDIIESLGRGLAALFPYPGEAGLSGADAVSCRVRCGKE